jgi:hypothetical protein
MAAQQPAAQTGRLRGEAPDIFHGDRSKSETFTAHCIIVGNPKKKKLFVPIWQ